MTKDEALKLALEALGWTDEWRPQGLKEDAITAIKVALEAKDEPWEKFCDSNCVWTDHHPDCKLAKDEPVAYINVEQRKLEWAKYMSWRTPTVVNLPKIPLYTTPPQRKPLTDEEIVLIVAECAASHQHTDIHFARAIEAKLRSKND